MLASVIPAIPASAESANDAKMVIFSEDFEGATVNPTNFNGTSTFTQSTYASGTSAGQKYGNWTITKTYRSGFRFDKGSSSITSGKLYVKFDFMVDGADDKYRVISLGDMVNSAWKGVTLLATNFAHAKNGNLANSLTVGGRQINNSGSGVLVKKKNGETVNAVNQNWYTYDGIVDLTNHSIDVTITDADGEFVGECNTGKIGINTSPLWEGWPSETWPTSSEPCDAIAVTGSADTVSMALDNIEVSAPVNFEENFDGTAPTVYDFSNGNWTNFNGDGKFNVVDNIGTFRQTGNRAGFALGGSMDEGKVSIHFDFRKQENATTFVALGNEYTDKSQHNWLGLLTAKSDTKKLYAGTGHGGPLLDSDKMMKTPDNADATVEDSVWYTYDAVLDIDKHDLQAVVTDSKGAVVGSIDIDNMQPHNGADSNSRYNDWPVQTDLRALAVLYAADIDNISIKTAAIPKVTAAGENGTVECTQNDLIATLTVAPNDGYEFDGWYDGETKVSSDATYTVNAAALAGDTEYTAKFTAIPTQTAEPVTAGKAVSVKNEDNTYKVGLNFEEALNPNDYKYILFKAGEEIKGGEVESVLGNIDGPTIIAVILNNSPSDDVAVKFTNETVTFE